MDAIKVLAAICPWPADRPHVEEPPPVPGWLGDGARELLSRALTNEIRLVVEIGSWVGLSTRFIADGAPNAVVIAIDHWCGSPEHQRNPSWKSMLPRLYETFLALCWDYRNRLIPLRMTAIQGLRAVVSQDLHPDLIYIDGEHSYEAVTGELELIRHSFPEAVIVGDDYDWPGVAPAVEDAVRRHSLALEIAGTSERGRAWKLTSSERKASPPRESTPVPHVTPLAGSKAPASIAAPVASIVNGVAATIDCTAVRVQAHEPRYLTFLDPRPETGLYAFARIADELGRRRPDIPILVVERNGTAGALFTCGVDPTAHGNVHIMHVDGDPRRHWSVTRVALLPWLAPEIAPGAALEAMVNGIPVMASDRGSAVDALGRSGMVLPLPRRLSPSSRTLPAAAEMAPWVDAIVQLWDDPVLYDEHRRLALAEAERRTRDVDGRPRIDCPAAPPVGRDKAIVLVPYIDRIETDCERGLNQLEVAGVRVVRKPGCSAIDLARSELASDALHDGAEAILFVDSDIAFDSADALRILSRPEPVIAGVYAKKSQRDLACIFAEGITNVVFGAGAPASYLLKYASAGFLRIRTAVLRRMVTDLRLPLCNTHWGRGLWPFFMPLVAEAREGGLHYLAEDWAFCHRLRQIGVNPMADTSIRLFHRGTHSFGWEDAGSEIYRYRTYNYFL
jgi:glycosyltransferase involved in cell wall biosynthesis